VIVERGPTETETDHTIPDQIQQLDREALIDLLQRVPCIVLKPILATIQPQPQDEPEPSAKTGTGQPNPGQKSPASTEGTRITPRLLPSGFGAGSHITTASNGHRGGCRHSGIAGRTTGRKRTEIVQRGRDWSLLESRFAVQSGDGA
jgi:hypothetical protein